MLKLKGEQTAKTFGTIGGEDYDDLTVYWEYQPAEPDVNIQEGAYINRVTSGDKDLTDLATETELDLLAERVLEDTFQAQDDDGGWEPEEWDGQPDEAQEWFDFDPDC